MQLRRIEVRSFRKLRHVVLEDLSPGLNVVVGDNEVGKSTLLAALRAVLFERHRVGGKVLKDMLPHGHEVRPEVSLDFSVAGQAWRLRKAFNQRPEAELAGPSGQPITGDAVEERLESLLGFQAPGSRGSKPEEHQGVYGVLWVDQGLSHGPLNAGGGQGALASALESEVGQVFGGERGRHLLTLAEERRDSFWSRLDRPRGLYKQLAENVAALEAQHAALEERRQRHDEKVAALGAKVELLARHAREDRLQTAVRDAEIARGAADRAGQLAATLDALRRAEAATEAERESAGERLAAREALAAKAEATQAEATLARAADDAARTALAAAADIARAAADVLAEARHVSRAAETAVAVQERRSERRRVRVALAQAERSLLEAERVEASRRAAEAVVAGLPITRAGLAELDKRCIARDAARARRDAASVQIVFETDTSTVVVDGVDHATDAPLLLAQDATIALPGFGRLRVSPGGGIEPLGRALAEAEAAVGDQLRHLGHATREGAADAAARRAEAEAEVVAQTTVLGILAPEGLSALRQAASTMREEAGLPDEDGGATPEPDHSTMRLARASAALALSQAEAELRRCEAAREAAARHAAVLKERARATTRDQTASASALASARAVSPDAQLAGSFVAAQQGAVRAGEAAAMAARALADTDPEITALTLQRADQAERAIRADIVKLTAEKRDLEVELRTLGQDGIGEMLADIAGRLATARAQHARQTVEARASLLLYETLNAAQHETRDRWLGPVRDRVRPYLRLLDPGADLVLNEKTFGIEHRLRAGVEEPFESLSVGAREQIAVVTRLALAEVLLAAGQPAAVILDDALVNTDEARLERMHLVLQKAAAQLQIIVLTCRERDFVSLGAPIHRL